MKIDQLQQESCHCLGPIIDYAMLLNVFLLKTDEPAEHFPEAFNSLQSGSATPRAALIWLDRQVLRVTDTLQETCIEVENHHLDSSLK